MLRNIKYLCIGLIMVFADCICAQNKVVGLNDLISYAYKLSADAELYEIHQEMNYKNYQIAMHNTMPALKFTIAPQYSHAISPITQPDGSMQNKDVNNFSLVPTLTFSTPIPFTGGTFSISSNFNYYQYKNAGITNKNYAMNLYYINISQPLNFFNTQGWSRKTNKTEYAMNNYQCIQDYIDIKSDVVKLYFEIINYRELIDAYVKLQHSFSEILKTYQNLYQEGRVLKQNLDEVKINKVDVEERIKFNRMSLKYAIANLNSYLYNQIEIDALELMTPSNLVVYVDPTMAQNILRQKQNLYTSISKIPFERSLAEAKSRRGVDATLNLGIGKNTQSTDLSRLFDNQSPSINVSINLNVPITDIKTRKQQYKIAKLQLYENSKKIEINQEEECNYLNLNIEKLRYEQEHYHHLMAKDKNLEDKMKLQETLLDAKRILFEEYHNTLNDYVMNKIELLSVLKDIYTTYYQIESVTMYDFISGINYLDFLNCDYLRKHL